MHNSTEQPVPSRHDPRLCEPRNPRPRGVPLPRGAARPPAALGDALRPSQLGGEPRAVDAAHVADARLPPHHAGRRAEHRGLLRDPSGSVARWDGGKYMSHGEYLRWGKSLVNLQQNSTQIN